MKALKHIKTIGDFSKMKKKVLLSSILTMVVCLCLIAGSTFALFTDVSGGDTIAVTSANVDIEANLANIKTYSVQPDTDGKYDVKFDTTNFDLDGDPDYTIEDIGIYYDYEEQSYTTETDGTKKYTFANGGTAKYKDAVLTLDKVTPGDKVEFDISTTNTSNVAIKVRYVIEYTGTNADAEKLMKALRFTVEEADTSTTATTQTIDNVKRFESEWQTVTPSADTTVPAVVKHVVVEFPVEYGNDYQNLTTSFRVVVEAVQDNANVATGTTTTTNF